MTIGVLGGGQLGRMLALAGYRFGLDFVFFDPSPEACAGQVAELVARDYRDARGLNKIAAGLDVLTYEFENVPADSALFHCDIPVYPPLKALSIAQDRLLEKQLFKSLQIPTPDFIEIEDARDLNLGLTRFGGRAILKARRFGYDGKGQMVLCSDRLEPGTETPTVDRPSILEECVDFDREVSIIAARSKTGDTAFYPLVENIHREGILRASIAPAPNTGAVLQDKAQDYAQRVMKETDYVGVLAIEFFQVGERLLANEIAPRVHNSGHWTIEGAETSQFENHLRAILGLPLGSTKLRGNAGMVNLIGRTPPLESLLAIPGASVHLYGKEPRPGRKVGHVTIVCADAKEVTLLLQQIRETV